MPYRGRYQLGQNVPLRLLCTNGAGTPSVPTNAPRFAVWANGTKVSSGRLPVLDRYGQTGLFGDSLFLGSSWATGTYQVVYSYAVGTQAMIEVDTFEIVAGGDVRGAVLALYFYVRPHANFVMQQRETARSPVWGRNPTV